MLGNRLQARPPYKVQSLQPPQSFGSIVKQPPRYRIIISSSQKRVCTKAANASLYCTLCQRDVHTNSQSCQPYVPSIAEMSEMNVHVPQTAVVSSDKKNCTAEDCQSTMSQVRLSHHEETVRSGCVHTSLDSAIVQEVVEVVPLVLILEARSVQVHDLVIRIVECRYVGGW